MSFTEFLSEVKQVVYHYPCNDGYTAMLIIRKRMEENKIDVNQVTWIPMQYGSDVKLDDVPTLMLDFSCERSVMDSLKKCIIIDHHKTAIEALATWSGTKIFALDKSGAGLAWDTCYPDKPRPKFVQYIEYQDLGGHENPLTEALEIYLRSMPRTEKLYYKLFDEKELDAVVQIGLLQKDLKDAQIAESVKHCQIKMINNTLYGIVNTSVWINDVTRKILEIYPELKFAVTFVTGGNRTFFSLRSDRCDVEIIAKQFRGGGHAGASGFSQPGILDMIPGSEDGKKMLKLLRSGKQIGNLLILNHQLLWGPNAATIGLVARSAYPHITQVNIYHNGEAGIMC